MEIGRIAPVIFIVSCSSSPTPLTSLKQQYVVGGWIPGTADLLIQKWAPVLQNYLTETVGLAYDPPISFKLIPVDYSAEKLSVDLIKSGQVDFVCKYACIVDPARSF